jgi:hypothetical protein
MSVGLLAVGLPAAALASGVSVEEADVLMDEARACDKSGDKVCVFDRMHTVLSSDAVLDALAERPNGARLYWFGFYKTGIEVVEAATSMEKVALADRAIALLEDRFPGQDDAAMVFHMMRAEAYAELGDLDAGKDSAEKALDGYVQVATIGNDANAIMSADAVADRLTRLSLLYKDAF